MANKRPKPEEIDSKLPQLEVQMGQGMSRLVAIRGVTCQISRKRPSGLPCWPGRCGARCRC